MIYLYRASKRSANGKTYRILAVTGQDPYFILQVRWHFAGAFFNWINLCEFSDNYSANLYWKYVMKLRKAKLRRFTDGSEIAF